MIQAATAYTFEIDEPKMALAEIRRQLDAQFTQKKHTAGILQCDPEYIESGVAAYLCENLDFPIVGGTSAGQAMHGAAGDLMLTLLVMTSDDVEFVAAHTEGLADDLYGATERSLQKAARPSDMPLRLIIALPPIIEAYAGDWYVEAFERQCGPVPVFGSLAVDDAITVYDRCATLCNGAVFQREMVYLLVYGDISPRFHIATVPDESTLSETGIITRAAGNIVHEINGVCAIDFFERNGLAQDGVLRQGVDFIPFLMTVKNADGAEQRPFVRALIRFDENGSAVCRGTMYEGAVFSIGSNSGADVLAATLETVEQINGQQDVHAALLFSCIVRRMTFGANSRLELSRVQQAIRPDIPFMMAYSGGEIAPTAMESGEATNRFHNYSFIVCLL